MPSKYSAARPSRASEAYARTHHGEQDSNGAGPSHREVKFDVRNPSALAPEAPEEEDAVLDADVIGRTTQGATKRGAVNIDGYDSDSDNETFYARAEARTAKSTKRKRGDNDREPEVNIADQLDNYNERLGQGGKGKDEDPEEDMFGASDDDDDAASGGDPAAPETTSKSTRKKDKQVKFLDAEQIEGAEAGSKDKGHIDITLPNGRPGPKSTGLASEESDIDDEIADEEEARALAMQEEGVDEEVGAGGLKRHAPKIEAYNMRNEQEDGAFDESGNFIRRATDPDAVHDKWLDGVSKRDMKKAAAAHEQRQAELRQQRKEDDNIVTSDLLDGLIARLEPGETILEALARLGKRRKAYQDKASGGKAKKNIPKWRLKKMAEKNGEAGDGVDDDEMDIDKQKDPELAAVEQAVEAITDAADKLLGRDYGNIYDTEREMLVREYRKETGEVWKQPPPEDNPTAVKAWEFRWTDGRDGNTAQGPFDGPSMQAWKDAGFFGDGVEFRPAGLEGTWSRVANFVQQANLHLGVLRKTSNATT